MSTRKSRKTIKLSPAVINNDIELGKITFDDSLLLIDPIHVIPGEKCTCGRPPTSLEKLGVWTYGDYLLKLALRGLKTTPHAKEIKGGIGLVLRNINKNLKVIKNLDSGSITLRRNSI